MKAIRLSATTATHAKRIAMGFFLSAAAMSGQPDASAAPIVDVGTAGNFAILSKGLFRKIYG